MKIMTCCKTNSRELEVQGMSALADKVKGTLLQLLLILIFDNDIDTRECRSLLIAIELVLLFEWHWDLSLQTGIAYGKAVLSDPGPKYFTQLCFRDSCHCGRGCLANHTVVMHHLKLYLDAVEETQTNTKVCEHTRVRGHFPCQMLS